MTYTRTTWINNSAPAINASNLNKIEAALESLDAQAFDVKTYGAVGNGTTDDTTALQAAINAAQTAGGGTVFIPRGIYKITAALTITNHVTLRGAGLTETFTTNLNRPLTPFMQGAVIQQNTAATDIIKITGVALTVNIYDLGLKFDAAIADTNTGHGINAASTTAYLSGTESGLISSRWDNVVVNGHDGNHYAFRMLNPLYGTATHLRAYGGGTLSVECDSFRGNYGNLAVTHLYGNIINAGTANGINLSARVTAPAVTGVLNLMTFIRPQINITSAAATAATQKYFTVNAGAGRASAIDVISPDFEGVTYASSVDFGGVNSTNIVRLGGILNALPTAGFDRGPGASYQKFTASGTFQVPDGVQILLVRAVGGGGGGGGGGSALTSGGVATQVGGGGGGAGLITQTIVAVSGGAQTCTVTIGAAGTGGPGGAANSNAGTVGGNGGKTSFNGNDAAANGGGGGAGGSANNTTAVGGGYFAAGGQTTNTRLPGFGGPSGTAAYPLPPGVVGGGGGGSATATNGGGRGTSATISAGNSVFYSTSPGNSGASGTTAGVDGQAATFYGCGGGAGGGGAPGGAGGNGGDGGPGLVEVWW